jgi:hypothetical protein
MIQFNLLILTHSLNSYKRQLETANENKITTKCVKQRKDGNKTELRPYNHLSTFLYLGVLKRDNVFAKNLHISFAAMTYLAEGHSLNALLMLKAENSLICLVGT